MEPSRGVRLGLFVLGHVVLGRPGCCFETCELLIVEIEMSLFNLIERDAMDLVVHLEEDHAASSLGLHAAENAGVATALRARMELDLRAEADEADEVLLALDGPFDAGARYLELVGARERILDVEDGGDGAADPSAMLHRDATRRIDGHAKQRSLRAPEDLHRHEIEALASHDGLEDATELDDELVLGESHGSFRGRGFGGEKKEEGPRPLLSVTKMLSN
jgi:hypothetical protein